MKRCVSVLVVLALSYVAWAGPNDVRRELRFPDLPGYKTLKCDLHIHTVFSDGSVWPTVRVEEAWREGLDAIAITDHIEFLPHKQYIPPNFNAAYDIASEAAKKMNLLLIKGVEITRDTPPGHFNLLFIKDGSPFDTKDIYAVFARAAEQNAYVMWNHPGWLQKPKWSEVQTRLTERKQLKAIEICNGNEYYPEAFQWGLEKGFAIVGATDTHEPSEDALRTPDTHRATTLVFAKDRSLAGVREALEDGRTLVWFEDRIMGKPSLVSDFFAACVQVRPPHHRTAKSFFVEIANASELDITLDRVGDTGPARIVLPAKAISLVEFKIPGDAARAPLTYRTSNFLVAPDKPLTVNLAIPEAPK